MKVRDEPTSYGFEIPSKLVFGPAPFGMDEKRFLTHSSNVSKGLQPTMASAILSALYSCLQSTDAE